MESHRDVIMRYLVEFDEILKVSHRSNLCGDVKLTGPQYCNELSMTIELDSTLAQAEVLFLSFHQVVADIDRRAAEQGPARSGIRRRGGKGPAEGRGPAEGKGPAEGPAEGQSKSIPVSKLPIISEDLRALLIPGK